MPKTDKRIDAYIATSADFAKPILLEVRARVHLACPDCEETVKWGMPAFMYHGILCMMAGFKHHATVTFWKGSRVVGDAANNEAMGQLGRLTTVSDLPSKKVFTGWVKQLMALNEVGGTVAVPAKRTNQAKRAKKPTEIPAYFLSALSKNKKAHATFESFPPSQKREYVEWIASAKGEDTRARRLAQAIEWMSEGKPRNWKYM